MSTRRAGIRRLEDGLDRWGADLGRWPAAERRAAELTIASSPEARRILAAAAGVDAALAALMRPEPAMAPAALRPNARRRQAGPRAYRRIAVWGSAGLAASLLLGFVVGSMTPPVEDEPGRVSFIILEAEPGEGGLL